MKKKLIAGLCAVAVLGGAAAAVVAFADRNEELKFDSDGYAVRETAPKTEQVKLISGINGEVTYDKTEKRADDVVVDIYRAENTDKYEISNGRLVGFISGSVKPDKDVPRISSDEAAAVAMQAIVPYVDDVSQYAVAQVKDLKSSMERYSVLCHRLVNGIPTEDEVVVSMARDGQICFIVAK